jgi:lipoate-protein ligase A
MSLSPAPWRLLRHAPAPGSWNMAVDEAILQGVIAGQSPPTLRLYAWQPACMSLGYAQPIRDVDRDALAARGWDVVRRPTGGRAILHTDELTYSVIGPDSEPRLAGGVLESYQRLSGGLLAALQQLAVPVTSGRGNSTAPGGDPNPVCFEVPSDYELTVDGRKLVGSAQARRSGAVLQHGTLPLQGDIRRITEGLNFENAGQRQATAERVAARAATVEGALGRPVAWEEAAAAFVAGFSESLGIKFVEGEMSAVEQAAAQHWLDERYANPDWTERV